MSVCVGVAQHFVAACYVWNMLAKTSLKEGCAKNRLHMPRCPSRMATSQMDLDDDDVLEPQSLLLLEP